VAKLNGLGRSMEDCVARVAGLLELLDHQRMAISVLDDHWLLMAGCRGGGKSAPWPCCWCVMLSASANPSEAPCCGRTSQA